MFLPKYVAATLQINPSVATPLQALSQQPPHVDIVHPNVGRQVHARRPEESIVSIQA